MTRKLSIEQMQQLAAERGGRCLSDTYVNSHTKLKWACEKGHEWVAEPNNVKQGSWCPTCARERHALYEARKRTPISKVRAVAEERGGRLVSEKYVNAHSKLQWECEEKHRWKASFDSVRRGTWCPTCAHIKLAKRVPRLTIEEMCEIAESRDGECLSEVYTNERTKLLWRCKEGHEWMAEPRTIKEGHWCPECAKKKRKGRKKLTLGDMHRLAEKWRGKCVSTEYKGSLFKLEWECAEGHRWMSLPSRIKQGHWCPTCGGRRKRVRWTIARMKEVALKRGGECLSSTYKDAKTKLQWRCRKGHEWIASPLSIMHGHWCPECANAHKGPRRLTLGEMQELAASNGGVCLSTEYENASTKLTWKCAKGHTWDAMPHKVKEGTWCPTCSRESRKLTIEMMHEIAEERGGKCLSEKYVNTRTKLEWECEEGHRWWALPNTIRLQGSWCPACAHRRPRTTFVEKTT